MQRGFTTLYLLILVVLASTGAITYYFNHKSDSSDVTQIPVLTPTPKSSQVDNSVNWKTYRNDKLNLAFEYPQSWIAFDRDWFKNDHLYNPPNDYIIILGSPSIDQNDKFDKGALSLHVYKSTRSLDDLIKDQICNTPTSADCASLSNRSTKKYGDLEFVNVQNSDSYYYKSNYTVYQFIADKKYPEYKQEYFDQVLSSFRILTSSDQAKATQNTYTHSDKKFTFSYPDSMEEYNRPYESVHLYEFSVRTFGWYAAIRNFPEVYSVNVHYHKNDPWTAQEYIDLDSKFPIGSNTKVISKKSLVNGNNVIIKTYDSPDLIWKNTKEYYFYKENFAVLFIGIGQNHQILDETAASFKFI